MIDLQHVSQTYGLQRPVLYDISFHIERGEFVLLTGASGAGKSTLLRHLYMADLPTHGQVVVDRFNSATATRTQIAELRRRVGIVFQDFKMLYDRNVFENIAIPLRLQGVHRRWLKKKVLKTLAEMGLSHKTMASPRHLSAGEKQRICLARALVNDPLVILADEPMGSLDSENADEVFSLLRQINTRGTAVLMATHQADLVKKFPYRTLHLQQGRLATRELV